MPQVSKRHISKDLEQRIFSLLINCIKETKSQVETDSFLIDLFTPTERVMMAKRLAIAVLLLQGDYTQSEISAYLKVSTTTVAKVNGRLKYRGEGIRNILNRVIKKKEFINLLKEIYMELSTMKGKGKNWKRTGKIKFKIKKDLSKPF